MTFDPNRRHEPDRVVVGYGADRRSTGTYAALAIGVLVAMVAIFYVVGIIGGSRTENANNPSETKATTGQSTPERTPTPAQSPTAPRQ